MSDPIDRSILARLPLPLAQLYRRSLDASEPVQRHQSAYYLWEASLRLMAAVALMELAERRIDSTILESKIDRFDSFSLGKWWGLTRDVLIPNMASFGDDGFLKIRDSLLGPSTDKLPRCAELYAAIQGGAVPTKPKLEARELFDALITYRNTGIGHGAVGMDTPSFYTGMSVRLHKALAEWFRYCDPMAGRRLLHVLNTRRVRRGGWLIEYRVLHGVDNLPIQTLEVSDAITSQSLPYPDLLYIAPAQGEDGVVNEIQRWIAMSPLLVPSEGNIFFYNYRKGRSRIRLGYLCYLTGGTVEEVATEAEIATWPGLITGLLTGDEVDSDPEDSSKSDYVSKRLPASKHLPRFIGGCEILGKIGEGASGIVYRARQVDLTREVALKQLVRPESHGNYARFEREMRSLARVTHPNVVKIHTSGQQNGLFFFTMDLISGADLSGIHHAMSSLSGDSSTWDSALAFACESAKLEESGGHSSSETATEGSSGQTNDQRLNQNEALTTDVAVAGLDSKAIAEFGNASKSEYIRHVVELIRQVAEGAHALHLEGIVHRDIKPANIRVTSDGKTAVLVDLGLVKLADQQDGSLTRTNQIVGTLRYASPEQAACSPDIDRRSDVYSLGASLWEMLTLRSMFESDARTPSHKLIQDIIGKDPELPRKYSPAVPKDLEAVVMMCLEKEPAARYPTAQAFADDLGRWQRGEPVIARLRSKWYRTNRYVLRNWPKIAAAVVIFYALFATVAGVVIQRAREEAKTAEQRALELADLAEVERENAEKSQREAMDARKDAAMLASSTLVEKAVQSHLASDTSTALAYLVHAFAEVDHGLPENQAADRMCLLSGLGQIAYQAKIAIDEERKSDVKFAEFDSLGKILVVLYLDGSLAIWDIESAKVVQRIKLEMPVADFLLSSDGRRLATLESYGESNDVVRLWSARQQSPDNKQLSQISKIICKADIKNLNNANFSNNSRYFALCNAQDQVAVLELDDDESFVRTGQVRPTIASDAHSDSHLTEAEATEGTRHEVSSPEFDSVVHADFSFDSRSVLTTTSAGRVQMWNIEHLLDSNPSAQLGLSNRGVDTKDHVKASSIAPVVDLQLGGAYTKLLMSSLTPDQRYVAVCYVEDSTDFNIAIWDLQKPDERVATLENSGYVIRMGFHPDGDLRNPVLSAVNSYGESKDYSDLYCWELDFAKWNPASEYRSSEIDLGDVLRARCVSIKPNHSQSRLGQNGKSIYTVSLNQNGTYYHQYPVVAEYSSNHAISTLSAIGELRIWKPVSLIRKQRHSLSRMSPSIRHRNSEKLLGIDVRIDGSLEWFNLQTAETIAISTEAHIGPDSTLFFSPDGGVVVSDSGHWWRLASTAIQHGLVGSKTSKFKEVTFSANGKQFFAKHVPTEAEAIHERLGQREFIKSSSLSSNEILGISEDPISGELSVVIDDDTKDTLAGTVVDVHSSKVTESEIRMTDADSQVIWLSDDGQRIGTVDNAYHFSIIDIPTGNLLFKSEQAFVDCRTAPDGKYLFAMAVDLDAPDAKRFAKVDLTNLFVEFSPIAIQTNMPVWCVSPEGDKLAIRDEEAAISLYSFTSGLLINEWETRELDQQYIEVNSLEFIDHGRVLRVERSYYDDSVTELFFVDSGRRAILPLRRPERTKVYFNSENYSLVLESQNSTEVWELTTSLSNQQLTGFVMAQLNKRVNERANVEWNKDQKRLLELNGEMKQSFPGYAPSMEEELALQVERLESKGFWFDAALELDRYLQGNSQNQMSSDGIVLRCGYDYARAGMPEEARRVLASLLPRQEALMNKLLLMATQNALNNRIEILTSEYANESIESNSNVVQKLSEIKELYSELTKGSQIVDDLERERLELLKPIDQLKTAQVFAKYGKSEDAQQVIADVLSSDSKTQFLRLLTEEDLDEWKKLGDTILYSKPYAAKAIWEIYLELGSEKARTGGHYFLRRVWLGKVDELTERLIELKEYQTAIKWSMKLGDILLEQRDHPDAESDDVRLAISYQRWAAEQLITIQQYEDASRILKNALLELEELKELSWSEEVESEFDYSRQVFNRLLALQSRRSEIDTVVDSAATELINGLTTDSTIEKWLKLADEHQEIGKVSGDTVQHPNIIYAEWQIAEVILRSVLGSINEEHPEFNAVLVSLGKAQEWLADIELQLGELSSARRLSTSSVEILERVAQNIFIENSEERTTAAKDLFYSSSWKFRVDFAAGDVVASETSVSRLEELALELASYSSDFDSLLDFCISFLRRLGNYEKAASLASENLNLEEEALYDYSRNENETKISIATHQRVLAEMHAEFGETQEARKAIEESLVSLSELEEGRNLYANEWLLHADLLRRLCMVESLFHQDQVLDAEAIAYELDSTVPQEGLIERSNRLAEELRIELEAMDSRSEQMQRILQEVEIQLRLADRLELLLHSEEIGNIQEEDSMLLRSTRAESFAAQGDLYSTLREVAALHEELSKSSVNSDLIVRLYARLSRIMTKFKECSDCSDSQSKSSQLALEGLKILQHLVEQRAVSLGKVYADEGYDPLRVIPEYQEWQAQVMHQIPAKPELHLELAEPNERGERLPQISSYLREFAALQLHSNDFKTALDYCDKASTLEPDGGTFHRLRAEAYLGLGRYSASLKEIDAALKLRPESIEYKAFRARVLVNQRRFQDSLEICDNVLSSEPDHVLAMRIKAITLVNTPASKFDTIQEAASIADQLLSINQNDGYAWHVKACVAGRLMNYFHAFSHMLKATNDQTWLEDKGIGGGKNYLVDMMNWFALSRNEVHTP